jgi:hypothetical protein
MRFQSVSNIILIIIIIYYNYNKASEDDIRDFLTPTV